MKTMWKEKISDEDLKIAHYEAVKELRKIGYFWRHKKSGAVYAIVGVTFLCEEDRLSLAYRYRDAHRNGAVQFTRTVDHFKKRFEPVPDQRKWREL